MLLICVLLIALSFLTGCEGESSTAATLGDAISGSTGSVSSTAITTSTGSGSGSGSGVAATHMPEPGSLLLMASGLFGLAAMYFRKFKK